MPETSPTLWERHYQTIIISGSMALMAWVGITVNSSQNKISILNNDIQHLTVQVEKIEAGIGDIHHLTVQVEKIEAGIGDRYRAADAKRDFLLRDQQIDGLRKRINRLEGLDR